MSLLPNQNNPSSSNCKSNRGVVGALLLMCAFLPASVYAEDAAAFRARVIQEVLQEVSDVELAKQIVEIRLNREFIKKLKPVANPALKEELAPKTPAERRVLIKQPVQGATDQPAAPVQKM